MPTEKIDPTLSLQRENQPSIEASKDETAPSSIAEGLPRFGPAKQDGEIGTLGKYRILKELGRGGMGAVYLAFDDKLQRNVALKIMLPSAAANAGARERFLREARAAARISSDYVVHIYEADEIDGVPYISLQFLQGVPLDRYLRQKGNPTIPQVLRLGREIALGLAAAHKLGLVHRDIKPGNIWLESPGGRVKILDFGLAKPLQKSDGAELTAAGVVVGTPAYMAPEQGMGRAVDGRADLFSLGCLLYRLVTGKLPFDRPTLMGILAAIATEEPPPVRTLRPDAPEGLAALIHRLLAKDPAHRPANALAVVKELTQLAQASAPAPTEKASAQEPPTVPLDPEPEPEPAAPPHRPRRSLGVLVGALLLGVMLVTLAGFIILRITNKDGSVTELKVPDDSKVELVKDGKAVVVVPGTKDNPGQAKQDPPKVDPPKPIEGIDYAAERKAAEWLGKLPNSVSFELLKQDGTTVALRGGDRLPAEPFAVYGISAGNPNPIGDAGLENLAGCHALTNLLIFSSAITDAGMKHLTHLRTLRSLRVQANLELGDGVAEVLRNSPDLKQVGLYGTKVTTKTLAALKACPQITHLTLPHKLLPSDLELVSQNCPQLEFLLIEDLREPIPLTPLSKLGKLREFQCMGDLLTPESVAILAKLPRFESLHFKTPTTNAVTLLKPLSGQLRRLFVRSNLERDPGLTDAAYDVLSEMTALESLNLRVNAGHPTDEQLLRLAKLPKLKELILSAGFIQPKPRHTAAGVAEFRRLRPDVHLTIAFDGKTEDYPALTLWPGKGEGTGGVAPWDLPKDAPPPAIVPFSPEQATQHQDAWAKYLQQPVEVESKATGMKLRLIPPGEFDTTIDGKLARLRITKPYYLGTTEVTVGQFKKFVEATGYKTEAERGLGNRYGTDPVWTWKAPSYVLSDDLPVSSLLDPDLQAYLDWIGKGDGAVYRLPTEAEWEMAARAGSAKDEIIGTIPEEQARHAHLRIPWDRFAPITVGSKQANPFGLHDMIGNLWEVCWSSPSPSLSAAINPIGKGTLLRGDCAANRGVSVTQMWPENNYVRHHVGFRVLRQTTNEPFVVPASPPRLSDKPLLVGKGQPLAPHATVSRPAAIPGVRSWSVELAGHVGLVRGIAWSPKGDVIATGGEHDLSVRLWDLAGNLKRVLLGHEGQVTSVAFSPDGSLLASCDRIPDYTNQKGQLRLWDVATGACKAVLPLQCWGWSVAFSPDGKHLAVGCTHGKLDVFALDTGAVRLRQHDGADLYCVSWSPDGKQIVTGGTTAIIKSYGLETGKEVAKFTVPDWTDGKAGVMEAAAWSPDGQWIAGAATDGKLRLWNARTREHIRTVEIGFRSYLKLVWHKNSQFLAATGMGGSARFQIVNMTNGKLLTSGPSGHGTSIDWSPDGREIAMGAWGGDGQGITFIDATSGKTLRTGYSYSRWVSSPQYDPISGHFVFKPFSRTSTLTFDPETGSRLSESNAAAISSLVIAPAGQWRAMICDKDAIITPTKGASVTFATPGRADRWQSSPGGDRLAGDFGQQVMVWDTSTGQQRCVLEHPAKLVSAPAWSPDGKQILTAGEDKMLRLWDAYTGKLLRTFERFPKPPGGMRGGVSLAWEPDGRDVWVSFGKEAARLDTRTGRVSPLESFSNGREIESFALSPDGDRLLVREGYFWTFLRDRDGTRRTLGQHLGARMMWLPDGRRFLGEEGALGLRGFDVDRNERLGTLWPPINDKHWVCIGPDGHYRGSEGIEEHLVVVAMLEDGSQQTFTPQAFAEKFGWKNDPAKARLLKLEP